MPDRERARDDDRELINQPAERLEEELQSEELDDEERAQRGAHFFEVIGLVNGLFEGTDVATMLSRTALEDEERDALELMAQAITGRIGVRDLLAEERLADLGGALAELQPILAAGLSSGMREAIVAFHGLVDRVEALRTQLVSHEDAQSEMFEQDRARIEARPGAAVPASDADAEALPSTLDGEPAVELPVRPSTLSDGAPVELPVRPSTLSDGAPVELPVRPSTLSDGAPVELPVRPSTLGADEA